MSVALVLVTVGLVCSALFLSAWFRQMFRVYRQISRIPGPPTIPILGNAHQMTSGPGEYDLPTAAA